MSGAGVFKTGSRDEVAFGSDSENPFVLARPQTGEAGALATVLVVATDGATRGRVDQRLEEEFEVVLVKAVAEACEQMKTKRFALALLDLREASERVRAVVKELRAADPEMSVMVLGAGRAVKVIGDQCLQVPFDSPDLVALAHHEVEMATRRRGRSAVIREMEGVIGLLQRELEAKDSLAGYGEASASMVHDLKNALFSTLGYTARLIQETATLKDSLGAQAQPIDAIAKKLEHTSNYLMHLAHTCRYNDGKTQARETLDLQAEVEHVKAVLFFNSPNLRITGPRTGPAGSSEEGTSLARVAGDRYELHRVFQNLFKNAFEAGASEVTVTLRTEGARVIVEVRDDGRGFPEDEVAMVFVQSPRSSKRGGQGLGLRICNQIIGRHGGQISLCNEPGKGATFRIWLPAV